MVYIAAEILPTCVSSQISESVHSGKVLHHTMGNISPYLVTKVEQADRQSTQDHGEMKP